MSTSASIQVIAEDHLGDRCILVVADLNKEVILFKEAFYLEGNTTLINTGLSVSLQDWHQLLTQLDQNGHAEIPHLLTLVKTLDDCVLIKWTTTQTTVIELGETCIIGREVHVFANSRSDLDIK